MAASKKGDSIIRVYDIVRVIRPEVMIRCGYPKSVKDYYPEAEDRLKGVLEQKHEGFPRHRKKVVESLAYLLACVDRFGGKERTLHTKLIPELENALCDVVEVRTVKTGTYYPPSGGYIKWTGEYDGEPGGLINEKVHRVATLHPMKAIQSSELPLEIRVPVSFLKKEESWCGILLSAS